MESRPSRMECSRRPLASGSKRSPASSRRWRRAARTIRMTPAKTGGVSRSSSRAASGAPPACAACQARFTKSTQLATVLAVTVVSALVGVGASWPGPSSRSSSLTPTSEAQSVDGAGAATATRASKSARIAAGTASHASVATRAGRPAGATMGAAPPSAA